MALGAFSDGAQGLETEREGFEPSTEVASCNSLAGSRFQPLSHLSRGPESLSVLPRAASVAPEHPLHPAAVDVDQQLVGDRAGTLGHLFGPQFLPLAGTEDQHLIAHGRLGHR